MTSVKLTEQAAKKTARVVRNALRTLPDAVRGEPSQSVFPDRRYQGVLDGTLDAGSLTAPTTATMTVWLPDPDDETIPPAFVETDIVLTLVNRDVSLSGVAGALAKAEFLNGEWSPYWVGCPE